MRPYVSTALLLSLLLVTATAGCKRHGSFAWFLGNEKQEFQAQNGEYFPADIASVFERTKDFNLDHPSLAQARSGLKFIQIKQLNPIDQPYNEANLNWSEDGLNLGFEIMTATDQKIMVKNITGKYARELFVVPKKEQTFLDGLVARSVHSYNAGLRWSTDSTRYAFMSNGGIGEYGIYVGALDSREKPIARNQTRDGYATWNPRANELAYVSARTGMGDIYVVNLTTNKATRVTRSPEVDLFPEWAASGEELVYISGDALNHNLYRVQRQDGQWSEPQALTDTPFDELRPTISPDGQFVAFYVNNSPEDSNSGVRNWNIAIVPLKSSSVLTADLIDQHIIARDVVTDLNTGPAWTPDSRKILYVKRDPKDFNPIYGYDLFSGERFMFKTGTKMNRDILMSKLGILSFRAQVGVWDRVFIALTNQGLQLQKTQRPAASKIVYLAPLSTGNPDSWRDLQGSSNRSTTETSTGTINDATHLNNY